MQGNPEKIKLGELLVDAGVVTFGDLTEAIQVSRRLNVPIGRVLMVSGCVTQHLLEAALEAQPLVKDGTISRESAVDALRKAHEEGIERDKIIDVNQLNEDGQTLTKRLAELLIDSEIVTQEQVDQAMQTSYSTGMPLGSALVLEGVLSPALFPSILRIQRNIRDAKISRQEGIEEIKSTFLLWMKAEESLSRSSLERELEELRSVYEAQTHPAEFAWSAYGEPAFAQRPVVVPQQYAPRHDDVDGQSVDNESQPPARDGQTDPGGEVRDDLGENTQPGLGKSGRPEEADERIEREPVRSAGPARVVDLLQAAGCLSEGSVAQALSAALSDPHKSAQLLRLLDLVNDEVMKVALRSHALYEKEMIGVDEAVSAIDEAHKKHSNGALFAENEKLRRYYDQEWRKETKKKVLGGMLIGAALAGLSLLGRKK